jgi:peptidoglycan hydrolase CwlO-like protein
MEDSLSKLKKLVDDVKEERADELVRYNELGEHIKDLDRAIKHGNELIKEYEKKYCKNQ